MAPGKSFCSSSSSGLVQGSGLTAGFAAGGAGFAAGTAGLGGATGFCGVPAGLPSGGADLAGGSLDPPAGGALGSSTIYDDSLTGKRSRLTLNHAFWHTALKLVNRGGTAESERNAILPCRDRSLPRWVHRTLQNLLEAAAADSSPPDKRHLGRHQGHELHIRIHGQVRHIENGVSHVL
jgi:hypothetical protein